MSSLWTPDGERRVEDVHPSGEQGAGGEEEELTAEQLEEMARLEQELLEVPVADVLANHVYGMFQLAALHLAQRPARLEDARLVIDALGAIVENLGPRLGASAPTLSEALASVRLAYVEIAKAQEASTETSSNGDSAS